MPLHRRRIAIAAVTALTIFAGVQAAGGAPAPPTEAPSISGDARYQSQLTCKRGSWGADAISFTYAWFSGGRELASGEKYRPDSSDVNYGILCRVTATDATGATTTADSPEVVVRVGKTTIQVKAESPQRGGKVTLTGRVRPVAAIKPLEKGSNRGRVVAYREEGGKLYQLFGKNKLDSKGRFTITAPDEPGRNTYRVNFNPNDIYLWDFAKARKKVNLKR